MLTEAEKRVAGRSSVPPRVAHGLLRKVEGGWSIVQGARLYGPFASMTELGSFAKARGISLSRDPKETT
jgi:hypothetical protein